MSKTPRTDKAAFEANLSGTVYKVVDAYFARQLESELAAAKAELKKLRKKINEKKKMSETPRTDEHLRMKEENGHTVVVSSEFAHQLETELAEALGEIRGLRQLVNDCHIVAGQLETERNEARAEIEKLREKMRKQKVTK